MLRLIVINLYLASIVFFDATARTDLTKPGVQARSALGGKTRLTSHRHFNISTIVEFGIDNIQQMLKCQHSPYNKFVKVDFLLAIRGQQFISQHAQQSK